MKKLLGLLGIVGLVSSNSSLLMSFDKNVLKDNSKSENILNNNLLSEINMDKIILVDMSIDVFKFRNTKLNEKELVSKNIIPEFIKLNPNSKSELYSIIRSYLLHTEDWLIIGLPTSWPPKNSSEVIDFSMIYLGADNTFTGMLNAKIKLDNINNDNNLSVLISNTDLGTLKWDANLSDIEVAIIMLNDKPGFAISFDYINFSDLSYNGVYLKPKGDMYTGMVHITYSINPYVPKPSVSTPVFRLDAYDSELTKETNYNNSIRYSYTPSLGKDAFLKSYSRFEYKISGYTWDNEYGKDSFTSFGKNDKNFGHTVFTISDINLKQDKGEVGLFSRSYSNTNYMKSKAWLTYGWSGDTFSIVAHLKVNVFATAWNAYWARAESQYEISSISLF